MKNFILIFLFSSISLFTSTQSFTDKDNSPFHQILPLSYYASGIIYLPYAEIEEPFKAFVNHDLKLSRIDYYGGSAKTLQSEQDNYSLKVVPESNEDFLNKMSCFRVNGSSSAPVQMQSVFPDLSDFDYMGTESWRNINCALYKKVTKQFGRVNTYTFCMDPIISIPLRYEMIGYDTLMGSHYDRYYVTYKDYLPIAPPKSDFDINGKIACTPFPGPGVGNDDEIKFHELSANPFKEFIPDSMNTDHVHPHFHNFVKKHGKTYETEVVERTKRLHNFRQNLRFINSKNRAKLTYTLAVNHLADKSKEELKMLRGKSTSNDKMEDAIPCPDEELKTKSVPDEFDWRLHGAVTPVKDQAICGSCWSFGTTGTIEGAWFLNTGKLVRLSQQNLMDCTWGFGNNACDGGEDFRSYRWIKKHGGIATEESYGIYLGQDSFCHFSNATIGATISGYVAVTPYEREILKGAIVAKGPISIGIDASHLSFAFYANGVYYEPDCGSGPDQLDHSVLAVGYGIQNGEAYWLVKNSWSTNWGDDGYVLMSQRDNNCGVDTQPTYVVIDK
ncbi:hypothetical protein SNEBB_007757 [Seison nebaliae]|nr:hypothetical protein SNEBB_007757 [Seison nebaliae]